MLLLCTLLLLRLLRLLLLLHNGSGHLAEAAEGSGEEHWVGSAPGCCWQQGVSKAQQGSVRGIPQHWAQEASALGGCGGWGGGASQAPGRWGGRCCCPCCPCTRLWG